MNNCVFCGTKVLDGEHHLVAQNIHGLLPNLTDQDRKIIDEIRVPICRTHHEIVEEMARVYGNIIRCILEGRPYGFEDNLPYRREQILKRSRTIQTKTYPDGNCIVIYPNGDDSFDICLGSDAEGYAIFQYGLNKDGNNTFIYLCPTNGYPITISTLIYPITTKGAMPYRCGTITDVNLISISEDKTTQENPRPRRV